MNDPLDCCMLCGRKCGVNRNKGQIGKCGQTDNIYIARAALHMWEEPCISGKNGSGAVFFSGCSLGCIFCQNYSISVKRRGKQISKERLYEIFFELKEQGAQNINLVTPTHYAPIIAEVTDRAIKNGLYLPVIYNTASYDNPETLKMLDGLIDIYLPDFKYFDSSLAKKYSFSENYPEIAKAAIDQMVLQRGKAVFDSDGKIVSGVIVRHLVLPGCTDDSKKVISYLYNRYGNDIYISIMSQYTPSEFLPSDSPLNRKLSKREYENLIDYAISVGVENGFVQEGGAANESFIPDFDFTGI